MCNQTQMVGKAFDIRLIPEFHGVSSNHTVSEWLEQVELVCEMCGVDNVERVLPLGLGGGALSVYRQLTSTGGFTAGKKSPPHGFCAGPFCCI